MEEFVIGEFPIEDLMRRFGDFDEAIIHTIRFLFSEDRYGESATLMLHAYNSTTQSHIERVPVKLTFAMANIMEFKIDYASQHNLRLLSNLQIITAADLIYLDFYGAGTPTPEAIREGRLYFACRHCVVKVEPMDDE